MSLTSEQAKWLRAHPEYQVIGAGGAGQDGSMLSDARHFKKMLALHPDGRAAREKAKPPAILVGVRLTGDEIRARTQLPPVTGGPLGGPAR